MLTVFVVLLSAAIVLAVGETVRVQCRRMLSRPLASAAIEQPRFEAEPAGAVA